MITPSTLRRRPAARALLLVAELRDESDAVKARILDEILAGCRNGLEWIGGDYIEACIVDVATQVLAERAERARDAGWSDAAVQASGELADEIETNARRADMRVAAED